MPERGSRPMKFNPKSPRVWLTFLLAGTNLLIGWGLSLLPRRRTAPIRILLYGHHFYGNLRAFYDHAPWKARGVECRFIYIDHRQYRKYRHEWPGVMSALRLDHMIWAARADTILCDRALGLFGILSRLRPRMRKVEAWHGVGFQGQPTELLAYFRQFDLVLASSQAFKESWHSDGHGPPLDRIAVTGFARTDPLVAPLRSRKQLLARLELDPGADAHVLIAPTWKHDVEGRPVVPFGMSEQDFYAAMDRWATDRNAQVVVRIHLNTVALEPSDTLRALEPTGHNRVVFRSMNDYPLTDELLLVSDVLVSDWSSISTDFLVLDRPLVFLDVSPPFKYGFGILDGNDRAGPVVGSLGELFDCLDEALSKPMAHLDRYRDERARVKKKAFDQTLDGRSSARYLDEILALLEPKT